MRPLLMTGAALMGAPLLLSPQMERIGGRAMRTGAPHTGRLAVPLAIRLHGDRGSRCLVRAGPFRVVMAGSGGQQPKEKEISKMKVVELKARLSDIGLPQTGLKKDLQDRLLAHYAEQGEGEGAEEEQPAQAAATVGRREARSARFAQPAAEDSGAQMLEDIGDEEFYGLSRPGPYDGMSSTQVQDRISLLTGKDITSFLRDVGTPKPGPGLSKPQQAALLASKLTEPGMEETAKRVEAAIQAYDSTGSVVEMREELRQLGLPVHGSKGRLRDRLDTAQLSAAGLLEGPRAEMMSVSELSDWLRSRGVVPAGTHTELQACVEAGMQAEAEGRNPAEVISDPTFTKMPKDLSTLTKNELKEALKERSLSVSGIKAELVQRLQTALEREQGKISTGTPEFQSKFENLHPWTRAEFEALTDDELREGLEFFGLDASGSRSVTMERLWPVLENEAVEFSHMMAMRAEAEARQESGEEWGSLAMGGGAQEVPVVLDVPTVVAVICGGPSSEAGISLSSARTVMDSLQTASRLPQMSEEEKAEERETKKPGVDVHAYFVDRSYRAFQVSAAQLYSHTPEDFEYKLAAGELDVTAFGSLELLTQHLKATADVVFPTVHGAWGEDGRLLSLLEEAGLPYVGSTPQAASAAFNKSSATKRLGELGYPQLPSLCLSSSGADAEPALAAWCKSETLDSAGGIFVLKPTASGSSIGVTLATGVKEASAVAQRLLEGGDSVLVQPYVEDAMEFSVCVVDTSEGPVALLPTEIELMPIEDDIFEGLETLNRFQHWYGVEEELPRDFYIDEQEQPEHRKKPLRIFDYSLKYLPSTKVHRHTPARGPKEMLEAVRRSASQLFRDLNLRDCARIDGWVMSNGSNWEPRVRTFPEIQPLFDYNGKDSGWVRTYRPGEREAAKAEAKEAEGASGAVDSMGPQELCTFSNGTVVFSDINVASGMEQASFLFQQAAAVGLSHSGLLRHLFNMAASRHGLAMLPAPLATDAQDLSVTATAELSLEEAQVLRIADSSGQVRYWTPPPDEAWDAFRTSLENGTATHGMLTHQYLPNNQQVLPLLSGDGVKYQHFPDRWMVHPSFSNPATEHGQEHIAQYEQAHPKPVEPGSGLQRVWVLMGGDTSERQVSLMSGINVYLQLRGCQDVVVEPFVLARSMRADRERRSALMQRRNYLLQMGLDEALISQVAGAEVELSHIQNPPPQHVLLGNKEVWAVPPNLILRHTVEEVTDACLDNLALSNRQDEAKDELLSAAAEVRTKIQSELAEAEVEGVAGMWSEDPFEEPPTAEVMNLGVFAKRARMENAVVFVATHGGYGENGELQSFLDQYGVLYTGSGLMPSQICMDKIQTAETLQALEPKGISTAPKELVNEAALGNPASCAAEYSRLAALLPGTPALCIKPVADGCSTGVARISCAEDLIAYGRAVTENWPRIPSDTLSSPHSEIEMPTGGNCRLLVEPFIDTDPVTIHRGAEESRWVEVTIGVIGEEGAMHALTPSITVCEKGDVLSLEEKVQSGTGINLTPPPASIVLPEALSAARQRCELIADVLGLSGVARVDAFMHADTGELVVIEVNTVPAFTPHTVLLHQALQEEPPMYPQDLFRSVVELALLPPSQPSDEILGSSDDMYIEDDTWVEGPYDQQDEAGSMTDEWGAWDASASIPGSDSAGSWGSFGADGDANEVGSAPGSW